MDFPDDIQRTVTEVEIEGKEHPEGMHAAASGNDQAAPSALARQGHQSEQPRGGGGCHGKLQRHPLDDLQRFEAPRNRTLA